MSKIVVFMEDGVIQDIITDIRRPVDYLVVDFSGVYFDKPLCKVMYGPFEDYSVLAYVFGLDAVYNPLKVAEIHKEWEMVKKQ
jgi:hypothetical protein